MIGASEGEDGGDESVGPRDGEEGGEDEGAKGAPRAIMTYLTCVVML
jgi:hypothetical protein